MKIMKKLSVLLLALLLIVSGINTVVAKPKAPFVVKKGTLYAGDYESQIKVVSYNDEALENAEILTFKSSKTSVIKIIKYGSSLMDYELLPKKTGKSTITVKYKYDGYTYTYKVKYTVKKYPSPFKYLKVQSKSINLARNRTSVTVDYNFLKKTEVKYKLNSGWKITSLSWVNSEDPATFPKKKTSGTFKFSVYEFDYTYITFKLKKKSKKVTYQITVVGDRSEE
ncbi:MAG: hypothetical protein J6P61_06765 [Erysipelotrichaceae bacterium]|nr:hypothetical protein [Erysipelotrichaceae bacterium]